MASACNTARTAGTRTQQHPFNTAKAHSRQKCSEHCHIAYISSTQPKALSASLSFLSSTDTLCHTGAMRASWRCREKGERGGEWRIGEKNARCQMKEAASQHVTHKVICHARPCLCIADRRRVHVCLCVCVHVCVCVCVCMCVRV